MSETVEVLAQELMYLQAQEDIWPLMFGYVHPDNTVEKIKKDTLPKMLKACMPLAPVLAGKYGWFTLGETAPPEDGAA